MPDLEFTSSHAVADGRKLSSSVTLGPNEGGGVASVAKLTYADSALEENAVWNVALSQPLHRITKLGESKLDIKRSYKW
jgi:hypothetical protein